MYTSIFMRITDSRAIILFFVFITILIHSFYAYSQGGVMSDDSIRYAAWADELISHSFDISLVESQGHNYSSQYAVFIYLLALLKVTFGDSWMIILSILNALLNSSTVYILLSLIYFFARNRILLLTAGIFYLFSYDILVWAKFVLSDSLYLFVSFLFFSLTARIFQKNMNGNGILIKKKLLAVSFIILLLSLFTRPTSIPLIVYFLIVAFIVIAMIVSQKTLHKNVSLLLGSVVCLALFSMLMLAYLMTDPSVWSFDIGKEVVYYYSNRFMDGAVVHDRLETYIQVNGSVMDFFSLILLKFVYFFAISLDGYSLAHSAANAIWFLPLYLFSVIALLEVLRKNKVLPLYAEMAIVLGFLYIFCIAAFTSVTLLDYDHRYRIPVLPILIMMAVLGFHASILRAEKKGWRLLSPCTKV